MGVFARLLRRSKTKEEAATAEVQADTESVRSEVDEAGEAKGATGTGGTDAVTAQDTGAERAAAADNARSTTPETVEIPQQQSAAKTADSEADEGARQ
ncbi:hypothetical protein ADL00_30320 [Streptomyces sp. AS58]|uniref:Gliding motility protein n=1 Tax=Streptomyces cadmiisoli TaxID=2184053 RepID=A0A2Z4IWJ1_9ACTN|nr:MULTISPECIES: hypothetical protein [Streptomyces]AWW37200.1 hypothetical protein DN051_11580 [Streptomyces cadmiisoli]KOV54528.1 hypothetical protein ADL00_30320 [Streptomyces sp. AS58]